jgi:hypothetical protein
MLLLLVGMRSSKHCLLGMSEASLRGLGFFVSQVRDLTALEFPCPLIRTEFLSSYEPDLLETSRQSRKASQIRIIDQSERATSTPILHNMKIQSAFPLLAQAILYTILTISLLSFVFQVF